MDEQARSILERLRILVVERINVNSAHLTPTARLDEIGIDSLQMLELLFLAEDEFKVQLPLDRIKLDTVQDVLDAISVRITSRST